jgi:uncharacterized protein YggE
MAVQLFTLGNRKHCRRVALIACLLVTGHSRAQVSGNISYEGGGGKAHAEANERKQQVLSKEDLPPDNSMFVDAHVLMNVKANEFVAVFGVAREGATVREANEKMDATLQHFLVALKALHVRDSDIFVDFISEPKIYSYAVTNNVAREKLTGFELKKNVSVHYTDRDQLDKFVAAAADAEIYDLVKVDYIVKDINAVQAKLFTMASTVIQQKLARDKKLLGVSVRPSPEVYAERPAIYYPTSMYDSYTAAEAESVSRPRNMDSLTIQQARKGRTFFFNGLDGNGFDQVVNPVMIEPVVQFTLYLKVRYKVVR